MISSSIVGTGYKPTGVMNPLQESVGGQWPGTDKSQVQDSSGAIYTHNNISYKINPESPGLGSRPVALSDELTEEEIQIYISRGTILKKNIDEPALTIGFQFDIPNNLSTYSFVQTNSYYSKEFENTEDSVDAALISAAARKAYISAALIECLLMLTDPTKGVSIGGTFGLSRVINSESDATKPNSVENGLDKNHKNSISDHVFGRAFDIRKVGNTTNLGRSKQVYAQALDQFLTKLSLLPQPLIPDLIIIHPDVAKEKGIGEGYESVNSAIKIQYPNLKYVNFEFGSEHTDNIHISFGPERGGQYISSDPSTSAWIAISSTGGQYPGIPFDNSESISAAKQKAYTNYKNGGPALSLTEMFIMLTNEGPFSQEAGAIMCAIAGRESTTNPSAYNGKCFETQTEFTQDVSIGMFQFNLLSYAKKGQPDSTALPIYWDGTQAVKTTIQSHKLAYNTPESQTWDSTAVFKKIASVYKETNDKNASKPTTDDKLWYPINQVWLAGYKFGVKDFSINKINDSSGFYHWGDYPEKDETGTSVNRSDCGFIFGVKFQDAVDVYLTTGNSIEKLEEWVRTNLPKKNPLTAKYIEEWMDGTVYYDKPKNGSLINESLSKPIVYNAPGASIEVGYGNGGAIPTFTKKDILEAAQWLSKERMQQWLSNYRSDLLGNMGCERFARVLSAALGLFGSQQIDLINKDWSYIGTVGVDATISTPGLRQYETAGEHLNAVKSTSAFFGPETDIGKNPPSGYLVFWSGGDDGFGHIGISIGNEEYVDQHDSSDRPRPRKILSTTFPGRSYQYAGACSAWS